MTCKLWRKILAEIIGTFLLVFFGTGSAVVTLMISHEINPLKTGIGILGGLGDWIAIALVFGLTAMVCIYLFGKISGAHLNPAVTLGLFVTKNISVKESIGYIIGQTIGACIASLSLYLCLGLYSVTIGGLGATTPGLGVSYGQAMFAEFIGTFFLVLVIMGVAVDKKSEPKVAGMSIGATITAVIAVLGPFTGASINPARTFGPYLMDLILGGKNLWIYFPIYLIGPILGGICAAVLYASLAKDDEVCEMPMPYNKI